MEKRFNIRVYGILLNKKDEILISDECRGGMFFTKFPGGGLQWGEGLKDCLKREFQEELSISIEIRELFYCTDFFVESAWKKTDQLISLYYKIDCKTELDFAAYTIPFTKEQEKFRWLPRHKLSEDMFTFPVDKLVAERVRKE